MQGRPVWVGRNPEYRKKPTSPSCCRHRQLAHHSKWRNYIDASKGGGLWYPYKPPQSFVQKLSCRASFQSRPSSGSSTSALFMPERRHFFDTLDRLRQGPAWQAVGPCRAGPPPGRNCVRSRPSSSREDLLSHVLCFYSRLPLGSDVGRRCASRPLRQTSACPRKDARTTNANFLCRNGLSSNTTWAYEFQLQNVDKYVGVRP